MAVKSRRGKKKKIRVTAGNIRNAGSTWRDTEEKEKGKVRVTAGNIRNSGSSQRQAGGRPKKEPESGGACAKRASGEIRAIIGSSLRKGNVWENIELPTLKRNPKVTKIIVMDPETRREKIIFERK